MCSGDRREKPPGDQGGEGGILGGNLGRSISKKMSNSDVDRMFFWLLIVITAISCYNLVNCFV